MTDDFLDYLDEGPPPGQPAEPGEPDRLTPSEAVQAVRAEGEAWVQAVTELRAGAPWPGTNAAPAEVARALVEVRARLDQAETFLVHVMALKYATAADAKKKEQAADDAWDDKAYAERRTVRRDFEGSRERYAYWNLAIREQRLEARRARELADYARDVHDRIKVAYDSLNEKRRDLLGRLTHLRWESSMEH